MKKNKTAVLIVLDAVGVDTLEYLLSNYRGKVQLPNLSKMGLADILSNSFKEKFPIKRNKNYFSKKLMQRSASADSLIGHREMMGITDNNTYPLFPNGFSKQFVRKLEKLINRKIIFNKMAGGIDAIKQNANLHEKTGRPILYASKCDPVMQFAMNEEIIEITEQKKIADTAFNLSQKMKIPVTRVIARPYVRNGKSFLRTPNRYDVVVPLKSKTLIDILRAKGVWVTAVGKTSELVNTVYHSKVKVTDKRFIDPSLKLKFTHPQKKDTNPFSAQGCINALSESKCTHRFNGTFIFANFVDTDSLYGHTRDIKGSIKSIEGFDRFIGVFNKKLSKDDMLIITADHGMEHRNDYGYHSKEYLPMLVRSDANLNKILGSVKKSKGNTLAEVGYIISKFFNCSNEFKEVCRHYRINDNPA